eukprot:4900294-Prymnesium_polylepis.1
MHAASAAAAVVLGRSLRTPRLCCARPIPDPPGLLLPCSSPCVRLCQVPIYRDPTRIWQVPIYRDPTRIWQVPIDRDEAVDDISAALDRLRAEKAKASKGTGGRARGISNAVFGNLPSPRGTTSGAPSGRELSNQSFGSSCSLASTSTTSSFGSPREGSDAAPDRRKSRFMPNMGLP